MSTYTPIASVVLAAQSSLVTISNLPQNYTDLIIVARMSAVSGGSNNIQMRFNGDTGSNYSNTYLFGDSGSGSGQSGRNSNATSLALSYGNSQAGRDPMIVAQINNYSSTTTRKVTLVKNGWADVWVTAFTGTWRDVSAITSISFQPASGQTDFGVGTQFNVYGIANASITNTAKATGGDSVTTDGTYWYHTFYSSGTFTPTQALTADYLVVAGGGGADGNISGGGGAGGLRLLASQTLTGAVTVTVGAGGTAGAAGGAPYATNGSNTSVGALSVTGGGAGRYGGAAGQNGGSGGGARANTAGTGNAGGYSPAEGQNGAVNSNTVQGGGGGGAGQIGQDGPGGNGTNSYNSISFSTWLSATSTGVGGYLAGGGGGTRAFSTSTYAGGLGGGGTGAQDNTVGTAGATNSGSGGGGGGYANPTAAAGGAGGSGIVIVRYAV